MREGADARRLLDANPAMTIAGFNCIWRPTYQVPGATAHVCVLNGSARPDCLRMTTTALGDVAAIRAADVMASPMRSVRQRRGQAELGRYCLQTPIARPQFAFPRSAARPPTGGHRHSRCRARTALDDRLGGVLPHPRQRSPEASLASRCKKGSRGRKLPSASSPITNGCPRTSPSSSSAASSSSLMRRCSTQTDVSTRITWVSVVAAGSA